MGQFGAVAQGALTNGLAFDAFLGVDTTNQHTLTGAAGDRVVVQLAKLTGGAGFTPVLEAFAPNGMPLGASSGAVAARLDLQADLGGDYTIRVRDLTRSGTGTYRLELARVPAAYEVAEGDEGGPVGDDELHAGVIELGDLDLWTMTAEAGDRIALQLAEVSGGAGFAPMIEVFGLDGKRLGVDVGAVAARLDLQAPLSGEYTVLVSDSARAGGGAYELRCLRMPGAFSVPTGDEGGPTIDGAVHAGEISVGDVDLWTVAVSPGDDVGVEVTETSGGGELCASARGVRSGGAGEESGLECVEPVVAFRGGIGRDLLNPGERRW